MSNIPTINVTQLMPIVAAAMGTGLQATVYDQAGQAWRAPIEDVVSASQAINDCICIKTMVIDLSTADLLAMATPIVCTQTPGATQYIDVISATIQYSHGGTDFSGGGNLLIGNSAGVQYHFVGVLQEPSDRNVKAGQTTPTAADSNIALGEPMLLFTLVNPTLGNGTARVRVTYAVFDQ